MIDKKWLDQLETLEGLREAVALRSYGSKNPLTEYKIDGFNIFDEMLDTIRNSVMSRVFRVRVQLSPEAAEQRRRMMEAQQQGMNAQHSDAGNTICLSKKCASFSAIIYRKSPVRVMLNLVRNDIVQQPIAVRFSGCLQKDNSASPDLCQPN